MREVGSQQYQVVLFEVFKAISNVTNTPTRQDVCQLVLRMIMPGRIELSLLVRVSTKRIKFLRLDLLVLGFHLHKISYLFSNIEEGFTRCVIAYLNNNFQI